MAKIFILTQYSLPNHKRNLNAYQRIYYGSQFSQINLLIRKNHSVSSEIAKRVLLFKAPVNNKILFFLYAIYQSLRLRMQSCRIIITEPSIFAVIGFLAKYFFNYFWVLDLWDPPRRRSGLPPRISDRIIFLLMNKADLFLYSIMPEAAPYVKAPPDKALYLVNAIDLDYLATSPPKRSHFDKELQVAYIRSEFTSQMGITVLIKAIEYLKEWQCPVKIHIIGDLPLELVNLIKNSSIASLICCHGFIPFTPASKANFLRNLHVGIIPFEDTDNLRYTFPIKVLEHMSQGHPIIASRLPGISKIVKHEVNGLLFEPGNPFHLADSIRRLQKDLNLWQKLAINALEIVKNYDAKDKNRIIFSEIINRSQVARK